MGTHKRALVIFVDGIYDRSLNRIFIRRGAVKSSLYNTMVLCWTKKFLTRIRKPAIKTHKINKNHILPSKNTLHIMHSISSIISNLLLSVALVVSVLVVVRKVEGGVP